MPTGVSFLCLDLLLQFSNRVGLEEMGLVVSLGTGDTDSFRQDNTAQHITHDKYSTVLYCVKGKKERERFNLFKPNCFTLQ